jgi:hypothetical protein
MLLFFRAPCAAIFVNGLPNIIALFLTEHHVRHLSERAAERYSIIFDWTPCADAIFQNELSNCMALFLLVFRTSCRTV